MIRVSPVRPTLKSSDFTGVFLDAGMKTINASCIKSLAVGAVNP